MSVAVWADGFGRWCASVESTTTMVEALARCQMDARSAIIRELKDRGDMGPGFVLKVRHVGTTGSGPYVHHFEEV